MQKILNVVNVHHNFNSSFKIKDCFSAKNSVCLSVCVRLTLGDWAGSLALGELSWPLVYGVAVDLLGSDLVHRYVGMEGYSRYDSPFTLTKTGPGPVLLLTKIFKYINLKLRDKIKTYLFFKKKIAQNV